MKSVPPGDGAEVTLGAVQPYVTLSGSQTAAVQRARVSEGAPAGLSLEQAVIGGDACMACAWGEATRVQVRTSPDQVVDVIGTRSWRGMALFRVEVVPDGLRDGGMRRYEGPVAIGDEVHHVRAPIIVHTFRTVPSAEQPYVIVEFAGAGRLRVEESPVPASV